MSIQLAPVDLSTAVVGTAGSVALGQAMPPPTIGQQMRPTATVGATLVLFNESGAGLRCTFPSSGESFTVPGGGWRQVAVPPGETQLSYAVQYVLPGANVSLFLVDLYLPGEAPDSIGVLGNSPIGVGGSVTTSSTTALKQDGQPPATSLIESTPSDQASSSESWNNDASGFEQVLSAGVLRDVRRTVRGNAGVTKAVVSFGDTNDLTIATLYGLLKLISSDGGLIVSDGAGNFTTPLHVKLPGGVAGVTFYELIQTVANGATAGDYTLAVGHDGTFVLFDATNGKTIFSGNGLTGLTFLQLVTMVKFSSDGGLIASDGAGGLSVTGTGGLVLRNSNGQNCHGLTRFAGTGSGTFSHGATATPTHFNVIDVTAGSSMTVGAQGATGTTVVITNGVTGHSWDAQAFLQS